MVKAGVCKTLIGGSNPPVASKFSQAEPWLFVVDAQGKVAAKFEAFVMVDEIEAALQAALGEGGAMPVQ